MFDSPRIFSFLRDALSEGKQACLVTVTDVTGASVRNPGAHMAVVEDGRVRGSLSGGCIEKAVAAEAMKAITAGIPHQIAYGAGTPIIDIRLPCGGRVDLLFTPLSTAESITKLVGGLEARQPTVLVLPTREGEPDVLDVGETGWADDHFLVRHHPSLRLVIAGHGGTVEALVRQAGTLGIACAVTTPDQDIAAALKGMSVEVRRLSHIGKSLGIALDSWTAVAFFFHDHDWETRLMAEALESPAFYIGAMGSRVTHAGRLDLLRQIGADETQFTRIAAPIGLIPSSRDPDTLALSTLAQIVDRYNAVIGAQFNRRRA